MSRTNLRTLKIKFLAAGFALLAGCLAAPVAAAQTVPPSSFTISTSPTGTVPGETNLQIIINLTGTTTLGPTGTVDAFTSPSASCTSKAYDIGTQSLTTTGNTATTTINAYAPPTGSYYVCASYSGDTNFSTATTPSGAPITVLAPTVLTSVQQNYPVAGQPITFALSLTTPTGQPAPTGTITIADATNTTVGTVNVSASTTYPVTLSATLTGGTSYTVTYSGDTNYTYQYVYGTAYFSNPVVSISPSAIQAGSPQTTLTVNGNAFTNASTVQLVSAGVVQSLTTTFVSANQLTAIIPQTLLTTAQVDTVQVLTGTSTSNAVNLNVYAQQSTTATATAPSSFVYGQTSSVNFGAAVAPSAAAETGLPTGSVSYTLTGPGAATTQLALGTASLSPSTNNATLTPGSVLSSPDLAPTRAVSVDLNGDGLTDIVSQPGLSAGSDYPPPYVQVFLSTGINSFQSEQTVPTGCTTQDFAVGDINGDGKPDIVALCAAGNGGIVATYMLGNGNGTFQPPVVLATTTALSYPSNIVIGDFNGDGAMDVAILDGTSGKLQVYTGSKTFGTFTALPVSSFTAGPSGITEPRVADFNQDGKSDIVLLPQPYQTGTETLELLVSNGDGTFTTQSQSLSTSAFFLQPPAITDVNGDGYPDVVLADPSGQIYVFENNGKGVLNTPLSYPVTSPQSVAAAPFPVIGKPASSAVTQPANIFFTTYNTSTFAISVSAINLSGTTFTPVYPAQSAGYDVSSYGGNNILVAGDFNGNGYYDAAVFSNQSSSGLVPTLFPYFYTNSSTGTLTGVTQQPNAGTYNLTASYPGSNTFAASTSAAVPITITQALPGNSLTSSASVVDYGQSVTYTDTITGVPGGTIPSGAVTFNVASSFAGSFGTVTINLVPVAGTNTATATYTLNTLNTVYPYASPLTVSAAYSGDNNYLAGTPATAQLTVNTAPLTLNLTSSASTVTAGTVVTFTVNATGGSAGVPTGEYVTFNGLPTSAALPTLDANGQAVYRFGLLPSGTYDVSVNYGTDGVYSSATSNTIVLTVNPDPVKVSLVSSANPVTYPNSVNLTAAVSSGGLGIPTGTVNFANNGAALGAGTLSLVNGASGLSPGNVFDSSTTANVIGEAIGDFNHDGKPDVAVLESNGTTSTLLVSLGNGDGTFQPAVSYTIAANTTGIAAADFNGDGYTDLAITDSAGNTYIYLASSTGSGNLALSQTLVGPPQSGVTPSNIAVATGDFNKDGHPDLAVLTSSYVLVYLNNGSGSFSGSAPVMYGSLGVQYEKYTGLAVADFNKDGYPDIALSTNVVAVLQAPVLGTTSSFVTLLTNTGATAPGFSTTSYPVASGATGIVSGDFNGDGYPDLAVLSGGDSTVDILINQAGAFPTNTSYATVGEPVGMAVADFNKDGYDDLAISGVAGGAGGGTTIMYGSASGIVSSTALLPTAYGYADAAADLNGDGNPDILVGDTQISTFLDSAAQTTLSNVVLPAGTDPLTATYTPDTASTSAFASGASSAYNQIVNQATPVVTWATPAPIVYGTPLSSAQLNATASVPGTFTYTPAAGTVLTGGTQTLTVLFQPTSSNYAPVTASVNITVTQATPTVTWATPAPIYYGIPLSSTQLNATASVPGTFTYNPPAGTVLAVGQHTLSVLFTPTDAVDYTTATASVTLTVLPGSILNSIAPASANLGDPATTITLTGAGFLTTSVAQFNGKPLTTTYVSPTSLTAVIPATDLTTVQTVPITVLTPGEPVSASQSFNVIAPAAQATFTGPSTAAAGTQPTLNFQFSQAYPVPVTATFTLSDSPVNPGGITDPAVQFASGGTTYTVTIPANSSAPVPVQLQTGTLAANLTVTAQLSAGGVDITPSTLAPVVIQVPSSAPVISSVTLVRSGTTLTVTVQGYSSTREVQSAAFHFTGANGTQLANPDVTVQLNSAFANWYSQTTSDQYGSAFSYVQTFNLSQDASTIGSVSVTLTNSVGASNTESAQ
ncbi:MAG: beta strand repeat-containing protein [Acidobacteriaceae bacterium]